MVFLWSVGTNRAKWKVLDVSERERGVLFVIGVLRALSCGPTFCALILWGRGLRETLVAFLVLGLPIGNEIPKKIIIIINK
jgi:hypothetical protein